MSYGFRVTAATKAEAIEKSGAELDAVVTAQPVHSADRQVAQRAVEAFVDVLADPADGEIVDVSVSGSLGWRAEGEFTSSSVNVSASIHAPW